MPFSVAHLSLSTAARSCPPTRLGSQPPPPPRQVWGAETAASPAVRAFNRQGLRSLAEAQATEDAVTLRTPQEAKHERNSSGEPGTGVVTLLGALLTNQCHRERILKDPKGLLLIGHRTGRPYRAPPNGHDAQESGRTKPFATINTGSPASIHRHRPRHMAFRIPRRLLKPSSWLQERLDLRLLRQPRSTAPEMMMFMAFYARKRCVNAASPALCRYARSHNRPAAPPGARKRHLAGLERRRTSSRDPKG